MRVGVWGSKGESTDPEAHGAALVMRLPGQWRRCSAGRTRFWQHDGVKEGATPWGEGFSGPIPGLGFAELGHPWHPCHGTRTRLNTHKVATSIPV
jgi:hypothetical protein